VKHALSINNDWEENFDRYTLRGNRGFQHFLLISFCDCFVLVYSYVFKHSIKQFFSVSLQVAYDLFIIMERYTLIKLTDMHLTYTAVNCNRRAARINQQFINNDIVVAVFHIIPLLSPFIDIYVRKIFTITMG